MKDCKGRIRSRIKLLVLLLVLFFLPSLTSCNSDVTMKMNGSIPSSFRFERNFSEVDNLLFFLVEEIPPENQGVPYLKQAFEKKP